MGKDKPSGQSERLVKCTSKPPDIHDFFRASNSPAPSSSSTPRPPSRGSSYAQWVFFRPPTPALSSETTPMDTSGDNTITSSSRGKALAPSPEDHEETLGEADRTSFQESFKEGPDVFLPTGSREKVEEDIASAATSLHNATKLINVWTDQGYCVPAALTDNFVTELLQAAYTMSEIGLIKHAVQDGGSHSLALQQVINSLWSQLPAAAPPSPQYASGSGSQQLPHSSNATSNPVGLHRPKRKLIPPWSAHRPLPLSGNVRLYSSCCCPPSPTSPCQEEEGTRCCGGGTCANGQVLPLSPQCCHRSSPADCRQGCVCCLHEC